MNKIQTAIMTTFVTVSMTTAVFAADAAKPVAPETPAVSKPQSAADAAAKKKASALNERNKRAKAATAPAKKVVVPAETSAPAASANPSANPSLDKPASKLQKRNKKAKENTEALKTAPAVPPAAK